MRVLVTGGSGYTGQFLEAALLGAGHEVFTTYLSSPLPPQPEGVPAAQSFRVDLATGEGLDACLRAAARLDAVVHTAALSQPVVCERDPAAAVAANVPTALLARLAQVAPSALFILFSTDNVYSGARPWWKESDPTEPVNAYGRTKVQAEVLVRSWPRHAILRCSLIYGPPPPRRPVARPLFLQWLDGALRAGPVDLFHDEFRTPAYVSDVCALVLRLVALHGGAEAPSAASTSPFPLTLNVGGPERLSRANMGAAVAALRGHPAAHVRAVAAATVARPCASPADISMVTAAAAAFVRLTPFEEGICETFAAAAPP